MVQYSSLCEDAVVNSIDAVDIGEEVLVRVQVGLGREEVNNREKQEKDRTRTQLTDNQTHIVDDMKMVWVRATRNHWVARLEPYNEYAQYDCMQSAWEKWRVRCICLLKSFTLTIPWNLANYVKNYPGIIVRQRHTDQKQLGLLHEQCVEWKKGHLRCYCSLALDTNCWPIQWNVTPICETFKISCLMARHPMKGRAELPFNGPAIPFGAMVEYHLFFSAKDLFRLHQFGPTILPYIFLGYAFNAGGIWKGDIPVGDIEELEQMDASKIRARRLNAQKSVNAHEKWKILIPSPRWNSQKSLEVIDVWDHPP